MFKFIDREECEVTWEPMYGVPVLQFTLKQKWTLSLKKKVLGGLYFVRQWFGTEGFDHIYAIVKHCNQKHLKFVVLLGFEPWAFLTDEDGNKMHIVCRQPTIKGEVP